MIYGLIGEKLNHSYSPDIHRAFFRITGIKGEYHLFELKSNELGFFLEKALREGYKGLNVTIPYKTEVIPLLNRLSPEAARIGAVNTITVNTELAGFNTDYHGISYTFQKNNITAGGKKALVTGSGGAAKSVVAYLMDAGIGEIFLVSRNPISASKKFRNVIPISYKDISLFSPFDIIINTTPVGMYPNTGSSPLTKEQIKGAMFLFDLIYNPARTELMKTASRAGVPNINGLYMLVAQAVKAQEIWNDKVYGLDLIDAIYRIISGDELYGI